MASGKQQILAKRYARALFDVCAPTDFDKVDQQLQALKGAWKESADFRDAMQNPSVTDAERLAIVDAIVATIGGWALEPLRQLVQMVVSLGKSALVEPISDVFARLVREYKKSLALEVTVARELDSAGVAQIKQNLSTALGGDVEVTVVHNPEILGGLTIRMGDTLLDRSVAGSLKQLAGELV